MPVPSGERRRPRHKGLKDVGFLRCIESIKIRFSNFDLDDPIDASIDLFDGWPDSDGFYLARVLRVWHFGWLVSFRLFERCCYSQHLWRGFRGATSIAGLTRMVSVGF
jgi:hypothetical protein